jgi:hypothetical protein
MLFVQTLPNRTNTPNTANNNRNHTRNSNRNSNRNRNSNNHINTNHHCTVDPIMMLLLPLLRLPIRQEEDGRCHRRTHGAVTSLSQQQC